MNAMTERPARASIRDAGRMGGEAVRAAGRRTAHRVVRRGGARVARLDRHRSLHAAFVVGVYLVIPRLFDPAVAGDLRASFELRIRDPGGDEPDVCTVAVAEGRCRILLRPDPKARVVVTAGADDLVRMASGQIGWPQLVSAGRLVLWGDPFLALRFPLLFGMPAAPGTPSLLRLLPSRSRPAAPTV